MDFTKNKKLQKPNMSIDNIDDAVNAIGYNAEILDTLFSSSNSSERYIELGGGWILQWGIASGVLMTTSGVAVSGSVTFNKPFSSFCDMVFVSDAGREGMSFGVHKDETSTTGFTWHSAKGLGTAGLTYAPNYWAIGK